MSYLDPTPWEDFCHKVWEAVIYPPKWFFGYYIPKVWDYTKLLWKDIDFEYEYILPLLALKTKRVREYLLWEGVTYVDIKKMREVELLCNRIYHDDYLKEDFEELDNRYPVHNIIQDFFHSSRQHPQTKAYYNERRIISTRCERIKKCDEERLFKLLSKNLHKWWS